MPEVIIELNSANLTASTKTGNLLAATELGNAPLAGEGESGWYEIQLFNVSSAGGVNATLQSAQETIVNDKEIIRIGTTLNEREHFVGSMVVPAGAPLNYTLRETAAAGTTDVLTRIKAIPMEE